MVRRLISRPKFGTAPDFGQKSTIHTRNRTKVPGPMMMIRHLGKCCVDGHGCHITKDVPNVRGVRGGRRSGTGKGLLELFMPGLDKLSPLELRYK